MPRIYPQISVHRDAALLLIDGVKYHFQRFQEEAQFRALVEEHTKEIFGGESVYFPSKQVTSAAGISTIPDGFAITVGDKPSWYMVEVELGSHNVNRHVVPQVNSHINAIKSEKTRQRLISFMHKEIERQLMIAHLIRQRHGELYKFVADVTQNDPTLLVIVDEATDELREGVANLRFQTQILEFKTFAREAVGLAVHAHLFEPLLARPLEGVRTREVSAPGPGAITGQREYGFTLLEALVEMGGTGKVHEVLARVYAKMKDRLKPKDLELVPSGGTVRWKNQVAWERNTLKHEGFLKSGSPAGLWEIADEGRQRYDALKSA